MADDIVLVALPRDQAHCLAGHTVRDVGRVAIDAQHSMRAALDRDPGELEARIADAIKDSHYDTSPPLADYFPRQARAVLAALSGQEDTDGD